MNGLFPFIYCCDRDSHSFASTAMSDNKQRMLDGDYVAITRWQFRPGEPQRYQITVKDEDARRQGNGYLLLSLPAFQELVKYLAFEWDGT